MDFILISEKILISPRVLKVTTWGSVNMEVSFSSLDFVGHWHRVEYMPGYRNQKTIRKTNQSPADSILNQGCGSAQVTAMSDPQVAHLQNEDLDDF